MTCARKLNYFKKKKYFKQKMYSSVNDSKKNLQNFELNV